jgi:hypothetical protein
MSAALSDGAIWSDGFDCERSGDVRSAQCRRGSLSVARGRRSGVLRGRSGRCWFSAMSAGLSERPPGVDAGFEKEGVSDVRSAQRWRGSLIRDVSITSRVDLERSGRCSFSAMSAGLSERPPGVDAGFEKEGVSDVRSAQRWRGSVIRDVSITSRVDLERSGRCSFSAMSAGLSERPPGVDAGFEKEGVSDVRSAQRWRGSLNGTRGHGGGDFEV